MSQQIDEAIRIFMEYQARCREAPPKEWRYYHDSNGNLREIVTGPPWPETNDSFVIVQENQLDRITATGTKVVQGQLIFIDTRSDHVLKLKEHADGEHRTVNGHMSIKLEPGESYSDVRSYTQNTN